MPDPPLRLMAEPVGVAEILKVVDVSLVTKYCTPAVMPVGNVPLVVKVTTVPVSGTNVPVRVVVTNVTVSLFV